MYQHNIKSEESKYETIISLRMMKAKANNNERRYTEIVKVVINIRDLDKIQRKKKKKEFKILKTYFYFRDLLYKRNPTINTKPTPKIIKTR